LSALQQFRQWLLGIPVAVVIAVGFALAVAFPICAQPLGEAGALLEIPFGAVWLLTCALVVAHLHRAVMQSNSTLLQFGAPVTVGFVYAALSGYGGIMVGVWIATNAVLH
jgi:hypothetical protein